MTDLEIKKIVNDLIKPLDKRLKTLEGQVKAANLTAVKKDILTLRTDLTTLEEKVEASTIIENDELQEFDNPISEADYYARYPFVKVWQDEHGGTAWENYLNPGKSDGRTWKKMNPNDFKVSEIKINDSFK